MHQLLETDNYFIWLFLRVIAGIIIFPYGLQKLLGWFDDLGGGVGIRETLANLHKKRVPKAIAWLIIIGQSFGSVALIIGCFGRVAAAGNFIIFIGAMFVHARDGWAINWTGKKKGEGIEYFVMLLSILMVVIIKGSGPVSIDAWLLATYHF